MGLFMLGKAPQAPSEVIYFMVVQFSFLGVLGALFALLLPCLGTQRSLVKGAIFGTSVWSIRMALPYLLQLPEPRGVLVRTAMVFSTSSLVGGITMAWLLGWLERSQLG